MPITQEDVAKSVQKLRSYCAPGNDGVCMRMFKSTFHLTLPYLTKLYNNIFMTGDFPEEWCESVITPIFKKGDRENPNNFRAISLVNMICKIFIHVLSSRLTVWAETNNIIDESQGGFRGGYSTIDNVFSLQALVQKYLSKRRGRFYVFYIDFLKAFDNCPHTGLWDSMIRKGVNPNGRFLSVFKSMYSKLKSSVNTREGLSDYFKCNIGTKQGCVSSPIIFILFINDLISYLKVTCGSGIFVSDEIDELRGLNVCRRCF